MRYFFSHIKLLFITAILFVSIGIFYNIGLSKKNNDILRVGILVPMNHAALEEIVQGFKSVLIQNYGNNISFSVQNAQGEVKLERSILEFFKGQKVDLIVPIGTRSTQMALSLIKEIPIISLAASYRESEREKRDPLNITGILDEIGGAKKLDFIKSILPNIKIVTLIYHSGNEKNFKEVEELEAYGKKIDIHIQAMSVQNLPELATVAHAISAESGAVLILKDHLIASGVRVLVPLLAARGIPLIASDEGSVKEGAALALGVREKMIGREGAYLAMKVLEGQALATLPMQPLKELSIFYHTKENFEGNIPMGSKFEETLRLFAYQQGYSLIAVDKTD